MREPEAWGHQIICEMNQSRSRSPHEALRYIESHFHTMPHAHSRLETMIVEGRKG